MPRIAFALVVLCMLQGIAQALPEDLARDHPNLQLAGQGQLLWFGLHVYDARLWAEGGKFDATAHFALDIRYARDISSARLVRSSLEEMKRLGWNDARRLALWRDAMAGLFPDVRKGETLTGVYLPAQGARFYHQGRLIGMIDDAEFAKAFFAIWLDPRTREPGLRSSLIGRP